jgi:sugar/nucleoside kinase (ribokinase family)
MSGGNGRGTGRRLHVAIGELLIDLVSVDPLASVEKATLFRKAAGGAPANVATRR